MVDSESIFPVNDAFIASSSDRADVTAETTGDPQCSTLGANRGLGASNGYDGPSEKGKSVIADCNSLG